MLEQIENQVRHLLDEKILLEDLKKVCQEEGREVNTIDDLTFGEHQRLFDDVRNIRNDVMHFDPEGIYMNPELSSKLKQVIEQIPKDVLCDFVCLK